MNFKTIDPELVPLLVAAAACLCAVPAFFLIRYFADRRERLLNARLGVESTDESGVLIRRAAPQAPTSWASRMDGAFEGLVTSTGLGLSAEQALGWIVLTALVGAVGMYLWRPLWWMATLGAVVGGGLMYGALWFYRASYRRKLQDQLPDALFLMARSLRAGLSLEQCITLVARESLRPLASEFQRCDAQLRLGLSAAAALENMARRVQLIDMNALVSTVALYQSTGGNLPMLFDRLAASARDRNQFVSYFRSATALGRICAIGLGLAGPCFLLAYLIFEPEYAKTFMESTGGWITLAIAFAVEAIGLVWLFNLLRLQY